MRRSLGQKRDKVRMTVLSKGARYSQLVPQDCLRFARRFGMSPFSGEME